METSDSEYFESADEDFESDHEERKKTHQVVNHHKLIDEKRKTEDVERHKTVGNEAKGEEIVTHKIGVDDKDKNLQSTTENTVSNSQNEIVPDKNCELEDQSQPFSKELLDISEEESEVKTCPKSPRAKVAKLKQTKETSSIVEGATTELSIEEIEKAENLKQTKETSSIVEGVTELSIEETEKADEIRAEKEDDLWDNELDWGSEAAKEESLKISKTDNPKVTEDNNSPVSKNEDSDGWDDFDAEWDSNQASSDTKVETEKLIGTITQSTTKENLWEDDDEWEPLEKPETTKLKEAESSWGGWGNWDVSSLLNTATQGVSTLTNHVSQGLSTVLESGIGIPDPEEMARINKMRSENDNLQEPKNEDNNSAVGFGLGNFVSGVTKFVETTGTKVITGGLDTLEAIGKKTVEVLQEGDPGLKKKRAFLKLDAGKTNLSQILREAKEKAEAEHQELTQRHSQVKRVKNYETLFDDHQGLVHLEALEMLSKLCLIKLDNLKKSLFGESLKDMQETLDQVIELCELPEDDEDEDMNMIQAKEIISTGVAENNIPFSYEKLFTVVDESDKWLENINLKTIDDAELHQQAIETLAQLTALAVEQFHKVGELLLVKEHRSTGDEAVGLALVTATLKLLILIEAARFTDKLSSLENADKDKISEHVTNIFYEAANSGTYIQNAFQLLLPVIQVGAV